MPIFARFTSARVLPAYRWLSIVLVTLLLASCQSSRPAFYFGFRPAPAPRAAAAAAPKAPAPPGSASVASAAAQSATRPPLPARKPPRPLRTVPPPGRSALAPRGPGRPAAHVAGRASRGSQPRIFQQQRPRHTAADFDYGKALGETVLAALYVVALVVLLIVLLSATTATGQLAWGVAFGVAALPLLYWIGRVVAALIRPARNARQHRRKIQPVDSTDGLGIFFAKVGACVAVVFLVLFVLGFSHDLFLLSVIGGIGFLLAALLVALILNEIPRWWKKL